MSSIVTLCLVDMPYEKWRGVIVIKLSLGFKLSVVGILLSWVNRRKKGQGRMDKWVNRKGNRVGRLDIYHI